MKNKHPNVEEKRSVIAFDKWEVVILIIILVVALYAAYNSGRLDESRYGVVNCWGSCGCEVRDNITFVHTDWDGQNITRCRLL